MSDPGAKPTDPLAAALSGSYRIERELGAGGMATVYLAEDLKHHRKVAVKVLRPELAASLGPERFLREVTIAANLQHPHILPLHDSGVADGFLYYVMPYVDGQSLREKLTREGELPIPEAVRILRELADALAHAHKRGVVHRDIKPENVMLSERHALVTDSGVAKAVSEATGRQSITTVGVALGTPAYMAPEQAAADPLTDHRADLYAFGIVAYELLTGRPPFTGATPQAVLAAQVTEAAEPVTKRRATVPAALAALVMQCLEKKPADRPQTAEELITRLEAVLTPSGGTTPTETRPYAAVGGSKRRWWLGLGVVVAAGVVFGLWRTVPHGPATGPTAAEETSIAVLPLVNIGGDSTQDYYADGVSEELANALGKVPGLQVAARTSAFAFKGRRDLDVGEVGEKLNVGVVLQGSVRRLGDRVKLSVQLTDTKQRVELWSEAYDQAVKDVFAMQDSITRVIVRQLALKLGAAALAATSSGRTTSPEAHDLYLRGLGSFNVGTEPAFRRALTFFRAALEKDPEYAQAYVAIAQVYITLADAYQPSRAAYDSARMAARQALGRDSLAGEAHASLAFVAYVIDWNFAEFDREGRRALELSPNSANAYIFYGMNLCLSGRIDAGLLAIDRGLELDRLNVTGSWAREWCLYLGRRYEDVITQHAKTAALFPAGIYMEHWVGAAYWELGRYPEALREYEGAQTLLDQPLHGYAIIYARMGRTREAREILARLEAYAKGHSVNPIFFAEIHASLGEKDLAFEWLERAVIDRTGWLPGLTLWPELDPRPVRRSIRRAGQTDRDPAAAGQLTTAPERLAAAAQSETRKPRHQQAGV